MLLRKLQTLNPRSYDSRIEAVCAACCRQGPAACEALPPRRYLHALVFPAACHKLWEAASGLPHFRRMPALHDAGQGVQHDLYDLNETRGVDAPRVQENCPERVGQLDGRRDGEPVLQKRVVLPSLTFL